MPFPQSPLPVAVSIAPGADPTDPTDWAFTDITTDVRYAQRVKIQAGRQDEGSQVGPTSVGLTVDNRSGNYCRTNPLSAYYGSLSRGTPVRVAVTRINDAFSRTVSPGLGTDPNSGFTWVHSASSAPWSTTGSAAQCAIAVVNTASFAYLTDATGADVEVTTVASLSAVATGAAWVHATVLRMADINNLYRIHLEFGTSGSVNVKIAKVVGGAVTDLFATTPTGDTYLAGTRVRTRARIAGNTISIRAWIDGNTEPTNWDAVATDSSITEAGMVGMYEWRVNGNTNAGTLTATIDDFRVDVIRAVTPVPEWPARWNQPGTDSTAPVTGAGILRRLSQGQSALRSPMYRQIIGLTTVRAYWPGEDGAGATVMAAGLPTTGPALVSGVTFAAADGPAGSNTLLTLGTAGRIDGRCPTNISTAGWQIQWTTNATGADATERLIFAWTTSNGYNWAWSASTTTYNLTVSDDSGSVLFNSSFGNGGVAPGRNIVFRLKCSKSGSVWTVEPGWYAEDAPVLIGSSGTFTGTAGRPVTWLTKTNTVMNGAFFGHVFVTDGVSEDLQSYAMLSAINGYPGETAGNRLIRLSAEENVPLQLFGDPNASSQMGAQRQATYLDLVRECEAADQGTLIETGGGLGYQTRRSRYSQTPAMVLDFAAGHIAAPPEPTDDDQRLRNKIILTRAGGSSTTAQDDASIAETGIYSDELTVNLANDTDLGDHANWRLHLGTIDELRWPQIHLQLHANPSLISAWCRVRIGSRITIANPPIQVGASALDLIVEGWTEVIGESTWDVELVCSPASAWQVGIYDDTNYRYDLFSSKLNASKAPGVTSMTFRQDADESWSTTATPYDLFISGERVTVTSMGVRSGTGPWLQAATVTRAVNGISKTLPANAEVHVATPGRYGI